MKIIARYIKMIMLVVIAVVGLTGCWADKVLGPKTEFYGIEKNIDVFRLLAAQPSDPTKIHTMDPNQYFYDLLEGSRVYSFEAHYPDLTTYGSFDMRINNKSKDAYINDVHIDWYVVWGNGATQAIVAPSSDDQDASAISIEITNYETDHEIPAPDVLVISHAEMVQVKSVLADTSSSSRLKQVEMINRIRANHNLQAMQTAEKE